MGTKMKRYLQIISPGEINLESPPCRVFSRVLELISLPNPTEMAQEIVAIYNKCEM